MPVWLSWHVWSPVAIFKESVALRRHMMQNIALKGRATAQEMAKELLPHYLEDLRRSGLNTRPSKLWASIEELLPRSKPFSTLMPGRAGNPGQVASALSRKLLLRQIAWAVT